MIDTAPTTTAAATAYDAPPDRSGLTRTVTTSPTLPCCVVIADHGNALPQEPPGLTSIGVNTLLSAVEPLASVIALSSAATAAIDCGRSTSRLASMRRI